jgi:tRNA pseudouridine(55) synthase
MDAIILAYKYRSETMAVCMDRIRQSAGVPADEKITYAGRLDPMADGLVIFLCGSARFKKDQFLKLSKTYTLEFFLGYVTDTYDVLGIAEKYNSINNQVHYNGIEKINLEILNTFQPTGTFEQSFPGFSSRKINGKPLFVYMRQNKIIPEVVHNVKIYKYYNYSSREITRDQLLDSIKIDCNNIVGDFRQSDIIQQWQKIFLDMPKTLPMHTVTIDVSSGFYVRQWVNDLGNYLSTGAVTFSITRGTIGVFNMSMLNGEEYRVFELGDSLFNNLTDYH